jgi:Ser/Thr protein kinase RdoA (MazF antagonist)
MPLFETIPVDIDQVRQLAHDHWGVEVRECLKASQNHTFLANKGTTERFALRVTPDPDNKRLDSTELEVALLDYLDENKLPVCRAIKSSVTSSAVVHSGSLILCLFTFATGEPIVFTDWTWMMNREIVVGLGRWFARLHKLSRRFVQEQPTLAARARHWTTLHDGVLAGVQVDERDSKTVSDPAYFGVIHGDVNPSNYYWDAAVKMPCMFDWDQLQRSWFLYDLSASVWTVVMLKRAGSPIDRSAVPQANSVLYTTWLLEGYESEGEGVVVDRAALQRMVMIRRELYRIFCRRAVLELPVDHPMADFCKIITEFFDKEDKETSSHSKTVNSDA